MDLQPMARELGSLLKSRGETVAVSESSTGGLVSAALLSIPGASAYFIGASVVYTGTARQAFLGIPSEMPSHIRSASEPYATLCARTVREKLGTTWALAETGAAGPSGNRYGDAPGHCCIAIAGPGETVITVETGMEDREQNMWAFTRAALALLGRTIAGTGGP